jgi:Cd2+/Zn2+-exporting ATPase
VKRELVLEGLDCANCAAKIEVKVRELEDVKEATLNFITKTLSIEIKDVDKIDSVISEIRNIVNKFEPHVVLQEKIIDKSSKKVLVLMGLMCGSCAAKIENEIKTFKGVKNAHIDFVSGRLVIEANKKNLDRIVEEAIKIVKRIEPDVDVMEENKVTSTSEHYNSFDRGNEQSHSEGNNKKELMRLTIGIIFFGLAIISKFSFWTEYTLYFISYLIIGGKVLKRAGKNILRGQVFDENFLMALATVGAFAIKEFPEGVAVMLFYEIGEYIQELAVNRSRKSIAELMDIRPDYANLKIGNDIQKVSPEEVNIGDLIIIKPGEKVPLDGTVIEGSSMLDTSDLTGESVPREVQAGSEVLGGFINKNGLLTVKVAKEFGESTVSKILELVQNASSKKAPTENFITKFARYYTPVVVFVAVGLAVIPPLVIDGAVFSQWIYRALVFLVISCPCALVVSIPLGFFGGIGGASKNGILIKGGNYLEALNNVETVVLDKTGTLTKGVFKVTKLHTKENVDEEELLEYAAFAESYSNHPIAESILKEYGKEVNKDEIMDYDELSGYGIRAKVKGKEILAGNHKLMAKENIDFEDVDEVGTIVHIAIDKEYAGYIVIADEIKKDSEKAIKDLKAVGVKKTVMLTGDNKNVAHKVARQLGLDKVYAELLPQHKVEKVEMLEKEKNPKGKLIFVGDGINDAPVLARSDIGVAMGGLGSDAAIEAADVVIMTDEPSKIATAIRIANRTKKIVWQNIIFSLGIKAVVMILGAVGMATMWAAVFADVGVALIAVLNAMRVMNVENI